MSRIVNEQLSYCKYMENVVIAEGTLATNVNSVNSLETQLKKTNPI